MTGAGSRRRAEAQQSATEIETEIRRTRVRLGNGGIKGNGAGWVDVGETDRANPIPLALIGVGVAWLLAANFGIAGGSADRDAAPGTGAARAVSKATLSKGAGEYAEYGRPAAERVRRADRSLRASVERHPLLVGLTGLICGAALGALLPSSRREQDWVDAARGELSETAERIGHEAADRVRGLAEQKAGATDR